VGIAAPQLASSLITQFLSMGLSPVFSDINVP
jgi:hypothetical protein